LDFIAKKEELWRGEIHNISDKLFFKK
jgi:hypothetical protein